MDNNIISVNTSDFLIPFVPLIPVVIAIYFIVSSRGAPSDHLHHFRRRSQKTTPGVRGELVIDSTYIVGSFNDASQLAQIFRYAARFKLSMVVFFIVMITFSSHAFLRELIFYGQDENAIDRISSLSLRLLAVFLCSFGLITISRTRHLIRKVYFFLGVIPYLFFLLYALFILYLYLPQHEYEFSFSWGGYFAITAAFSTFPSGSAPDYHGSAPDYQSRLAGMSGLAVLGTRRPTGSLGRSTHDLVESK
jgi:hypothetical protein